jgi:hypothetical protein
MAPRKVLRLRFALEASEITYAQATTFPSIAAESFNSCSLLPLPHPRPDLCLQTVVSSVMGWTTPDGIDVSD